MKTLYRFELDCGRMGCLESLFISTPEDIKRLMGKNLEFGEILGKHSDIGETLTDEHISIISEDQDFIQKLEWLLGRSISGPCIFNARFEALESGADDLDDIEDAEDYLWLENYT